MFFLEVTCGVKEVEVFGSPSEGFSQKNIKFPKFHIGEFETVPECFRCFQKRQHQNTRVSIIIL